MSELKRVQQYLEDYKKAEEKSKQIRSDTEEEIQSIVSNNQAMLEEIERLKQLIHQNEDTMRVMRQTAYQEGIDQLEAVDQQYENTTYYVKLGDLLEELFTLAGINREDAFLYFDSSKATLENVWLYHKNDFLSVALIDGKMKKLETGFPLKLYITSIEDKHKKWKIRWIGHWNDTCDNGTKLLDYLKIERFVNQKGNYCTWLVPTEDFEEIYIPYHLYDLVDIGDLVMFGDIELMREAFQNVIIRNLQELEKEDKKVLKKKKKHS